MLGYDAGVFVVCLVVAQATVGAVELLRDRGWLPTQLARKVMHISECCCPQLIDACIWWAAYVMTD
jgi:hypothetical protein